MKKLFLFDAFALIYRAHFAFIKNPRITSKGQNVSAIFGFINTLLDVMTNESPTHMAVAFDSIDPTERHVEFSDYKANREAMPEDIVAAIPIIKTLLEAMGIHVLESSGYEADDIIGTLCKMSEQHGFSAYCVSSDKDFAQLVSENVFLYRPGRMGNKAEIWDIHKVKEHWDIKRAEQVIDILGLWGDAVDNIPGVPGVGEKRAKQLIKEFGSMEAIIENADKIPGKLGENIKTFQEQALLSKNLATIITDVPIAWDEEGMIIKDLEKEKLKPLFEDLEFRAIWRRLFKEELSYSGKTSLKENEQALFEIEEDKNKKEQKVETKHESFSKDECSYTLIQEMDDYQVLANNLLNQKAICIDTETDGLDVMNAHLIGLSICYEPKKAYYVPIPDKTTEIEKFISYSKHFLENENIIKIGQNIKFDIQIFANLGIQLKGKIHDTMLAHYLIEPEGKHGLDDMALKYLNYQTISITELIGEKKGQQLSMKEVPLEQITDYASEDTDITLRLQQHFTPMVKNDGLEKIYDIECDLIYVLSDMERTGVKIDVEYLENYSKELEISIIEEERNIFNEVGEEFNIASPKQLGEILFDKLKLSSNPVKTKTGQYKTDESVLRKLSKKHEIVQHILGFRELNKLKSTYVDALPKMVGYKTGRVHTIFNQALAVTGRLSSNNPNLQNIPIKTENGRKVRKAFITENKDSMLLSADYSQIEIRIMAAFSKDENMIQAFINGEDIHTDTASKIYGVALNAVTPEQRRNAKAINFGIIYGQTAFGLSQSLNISRTEAKDIIEAYFEKFHGVKKYIDNIQEQARKDGFVSTLLGRRRYLHDINSSNNTLRGFAERNAINMPIQGTAADMIKIAMNNIAYQLKKHKLKSKMILQVHDELVFEVKRDEIDKMREMVTQEMQQALPFEVPILVETATGNNWLEAH